MSEKAYLSIKSFRKVGLDTRLAGEDPLGCSPEAPLYLA